MNEFKYTADQIVNNSRFSCLKNFWHQQKQAGSAFTVPLTRQKEDLPEHRHQLNPTITMKRKK